MEVVYATPKIDKFIRALDDKLAARAVRTIDLLETYGHELKLPHSKGIGRGLFELRVVGETPIRIIFCFHERRAYLLHIFLKKSRRIPKGDFEYAFGVKKAVLA